MYKNIQHKIELTARIDAILSAQPEPAAVPQAVPVPCAKCAEHCKEILSLENAITIQAEELRFIKSRTRNEFWAWQTEGGNNLESLTCPVLIRASDLRELLKSADPQGERFEGFVHCESDPYECTFRGKETEPDDVPATLIIHPDKPAETAAEPRILQHYINVFQDGTTSGSYSEQIDMPLPYGGVVHHATVTIGEPVAVPQSVAASEPTPEPLPEIPAGVWWDGKVFRRDDGVMMLCGFQDEWYPHRDRFPTAPPATEPADYEDYDDSPQPADPIGVAPIVKSAVVVMPMQTVTSTTEAVAAAMQGQCGTTISFPATASGPTRNILSEQIAGMKRTISQRNRHIGDLRRKLAKADSRIRELESKKPQPAVPSDLLGMIDELHCKVAITNDIAYRISEIKSAVAKLEADNAKLLAEREWTRDVIRFWSGRDCLQRISLFLRQPHLGQ
jgi:hypothetical protein